jgi:biopolymer transport protein TolR
MTTQSRATLSAEPNVTPMIDVMLVLLIVFMVMAVQVHRTMDVQMAQPCTGTCEGTASIVLEVLPGPAYRINQSPVAPNELASRISEIYAPRPDKIIQIAGHPGVSYDAIMRAMDIAKGAGVVAIGIAPRARANASVGR